MLKDIMLLKWKLPKWFIPTVWIVFLSNSLWTWGRLAMNMLHGLYIAPGPRWLFVLDGLQQLLSSTFYLLSNLAYLAIVGVVLMAAQKILSKQD